MDFGLVVIGVSLALGVLFAVLALVEHRRLIELRRRLRERLPLDLEAYPAELRADAEAAIVELADALRFGAAADDGTVGQDAGSDGADELPATAPRVVGICGFPQSGKDVVADYLQSTYRGVRRFAFSDAIIAEANEYLAEFGHRIGPNNKNDAHNRHLLQAWGMGRRAEDLEYWTVQVKRRVADLQAQSGTRLVIVTGARVPVDPESGEPNVRDIEVIREMGGEVWNVERPGNNYKAAAGHGVEAGLALLGPEHFDQVIFNSVEGDLAAYHENVEAVLNGRRQPHLPS